MTTYKNLHLADLQTQGLTLRQKIAWLKFLTSKDAQRQFMGLSNSQKITVWCFSKDVTEYLSRVLLDLKVDLCDTKGYYFNTFDIAITQMALKLFTRKVYKTEASLIIQEHSLDALNKLIILLDFNIVEKYENEIIIILQKNKEKTTPEDMNYVFGEKGLLTDYNLQFLTY